MSNKSNFLRDVLNNYNLKIPKEYSGKFLPIEELDVRLCKLDAKYQSHVTPGYIRKGGALDLTKLIPPVIARRPDHLDDEDKGVFVIDGQHRCLRVIKSN